MKRDRQSVNIRHAEMLALIRERQEVLVDELSEIFGVSTMTVRRDLQALEERGKISRFHGGATTDVRGTVEVEKGDVEACRQRIARYAASLVKDRSSVLINGSNTALDLLDYLADKRVSVFTNNSMAVRHRYAPGVDVVLSGGVLRGSRHILTGDLAMRNLMDVHADLAFLGCTGISEDGEILCGIPSELGINETMIEHAKDYYILCDHTKVGRSSAYASFHLEKKGTVITDEHAPEDVVEQLRAIGMEVVQVRRSDLSNLKTGGPSPDNISKGVTIP
ncbi:MAG: DeoR/GlpR transcriptional regulator [Clostridia bacterium]|nr:DeoR/GlpR transcriptional regulator [Clostridia bacterium]